MCSNRGGKSKGKYCTGLCTGFVLRVLYCILVESNTHFVDRAPRNCKLLGKTLGTGEARPLELHADGHLLHNGVALDRHFVLAELCVAPARCARTLSAPPAHIDSWTPQECRQFRVCVNALSAALEWSTRSHSFALMRTRPHSSQFLRVNNGMKGEMGARNAHYVAFLPGEGRSLSRTTSAS